MKNHRARDATRLAPSARTLTAERYARSARPLTRPSAIRLSGYHRYARARLRARASLLVARAPPWRARARYTPAGTHGGAGVLACSARPTAGRTPLEVILSRSREPDATPCGVVARAIVRISPAIGVVRVACTPEPVVARRDARRGPSGRSDKLRYPFFRFSWRETSRRTSLAVRRRLRGANHSAPAARSRGWATRDESRERSARSGGNLTVAAALLQPSIPQDCFSLSIALLPSIPQDLCRVEPPASREGRGGAREELSVRPSSRRLLCRRLARERARRAGPPER